MAAYIVVQIRVHDAARYDDYKAAAQVTLKSFGGRYVVRGAPCETLEGAWAPTRFVVLEFPDQERARAWWSSAEYAPAKAIRHATAETDMILVEGIGA
jgi:uncharacterized protein (DUF1330 family)